MVRAIAGDGMFIAALFFELLAALSLLDRVHFITLPEAFAPVMAFYRDEAIPLIAPLAYLLQRMLPDWLPDAAFIASVFFFHFFIAQARRASAPLDNGQREGKKERLEAFIDWAWPTAACSLGAIVSGPSLLPLLTIPAALAWRIARRGFWFEVRASYFNNLLGLALLPALIAALKL